MKSDLNFITDNLATLQARIHAAARQHGRLTEDIRLIAVSKKKPVPYILAAYEFGQHDFGESYVQEAVAKIEQLRDYDITWHFIGPIQKNKTRLIAQHFDWVHSIDREVVAQRLSEQRDTSRPPLNVCIQVNVDREDTKSGVQSDELNSLATSIDQLTGLRLRGLMTLPAKYDSFEQQRKSFRHLHDLLLTLQAEGHAVDTLSMGMSDDLEAAICEGATMIRVGSAIFGQRE